MRIWLLVFLGFIQAYPLQGGSEDTERKVDELAQAFGKVNLKEYPLSDSVYEEGSLHLIDLKVPKDKYLGLKINFNPIHALAQILGEDLRLNLEDRGEAHITILTPPEIDNLIKTYHLEIEYIHKLATQLLSNVSFEVKFLGALNKGQSQSFFLVVSSKEMLAFRTEIKNQCQKRKGVYPMYDFFPDKFTPHITVGYIKSDVHGIPKDEKTKFAEISIVKASE